MNLEWKGEPVAVRELGQGPPVVLVHGYPLDGAMWSGVARALSTRFRVFKPDLPGRGENPTLSAGSIDDYADFIGAILGTLPDSPGLLARIAAPTLVLAGVEDAITPPAECEAMAAAIPGARYVPIPAAGHLTPMERPGAVAAALSEFFAENLAGASPVANGS